MYTEFNPRPYEAHRLALDLVPAGRKVLDLGCATGYMARELVRKSCTVFGVEKDPEAAKEARKYSKAVIEGDLEEPTLLQLPKHAFDVVLCMDVIEHLINRAQLLRYIRQWLTPDGFLILSTPNIAHLSIRWKLLFGDFTYGPRGILDETHVHFFTKKTLTQVLKQSGFLIDKLLPTADFGQIPITGRFLRYVPKSIQFRVTSLAPTLLGVQYIALCRPR